MFNNKEKTQLTDSEQLVVALGTTLNSNDAGFILSDGRLLDLQRNSASKRLNHLNIFKLLPRFQSQITPISEMDMIAVMAKEQLIRCSITGSIHSAIHPTSIQMRKIYNMLAYRSSTFEIILSNAGGMTLAQHQVSGPSMAKLVNIFKIYQNKAPFITSDEFSVQQTPTHYQLVFRPSRKVVGSMNKKSHMLKIEKEYKDAGKLFYQLISEL